MKRVALASLVALAASLPTLSHAADGQVNFWGSVSDTTCDINPGDINKEVKFKLVKPGDFTVNGQKATANAEIQPFSVRLANCVFEAANTTPKAHIKFDDLDPRIDKANGGLMNQYGDGYAQNVQLNIFTDPDATAAGKVMLGNSSANAKKFNIDTSTKSVSLDYYAALVRQDTIGAGGVRPGVYHSLIRYQVAYD